MKTKLTYGLIGVIAMALGCLYEPTRTFNYDVLYSITSFSSSTTSPKPSEKKEINLSNVTSSDLANFEATLDATVNMLTRVEEEIAAAGTEIANARQQQSLLPTQIEQLRLTLARLTKEINVAKVEAVTAEQSYADFATTIANRKANAKQSLAASLRDDYEQSVANIKLARQSRDELRARMGARPEVQSEAQLESLRTRQAREHAQQKYVATLQREYETIDAEVASLASRLSSAKKQLHSLYEASDSNEQLIQKKSKELIVAAATLASLPSRFERLQNEQSRLISARLTQSNDVRLARAALQKKSELLAEQRRQKELGRQRSTNPVASSQPSAQYHVSTRRNDSARPTYISTASSISRPTAGYYNSYLPSVGNHYVRGHTRNDGTYVSGHRRTDADDSFWNNWSSRGNVNPYTGRQGTKLPSYSYGGGGSTYVRGHYRSNGTYVSGHYRTN
jgi:chromosome segregation ATPase